MKHLCSCTRGGAGWAALASLAVMFALVVGAYANKEASKPKIPPGEATAGMPASGASVALGDGGGVAGCPASSCVGGSCTLTQSLDTVTDAGNQIACGVSGVGTTVNGWARCYDLLAEGVPGGGPLTINSVTFGVQQATINGINIDVVLYLDCNDCPPVAPGDDATELARESVQVGMADVGTFITVDFPGAPVVPAGVDLIVEINQMDDGTVPPEFQFRTMSNANGQCGPSYLRAADCGAADWTDLADLGFPDAHLIQIINGTVGGVPTVECPTIPEACAPDAGPCDQPNGTPGCEDESCCAAVCLVLPTCCSIEWDQTCVDIAIGLGCVAEPCIPPKGDEGVPVPSSDDFDSYPNGMPLDGVNGWGGWDGDPLAVANVTNAQSHSAPHSVEINAADDAVQQYVGAYCEGQWVYTIWQYVPSNMVGTSYFILLNTYTEPGNFNWSTQVSFTATTGIVNSEFENDQLPLITNQWVELRVEIDLDANVQEFFYGGDLLYSKSWTEGVSTGGEPWIRTVDLYANSATSVYYDDVSLDVGGQDTCPWDLNDSGNVDILDLLMLLAEWGTDPGGPPDFDGDGTVGILDLLTLLANWGACP